MVTKQKPLAKGGFCLFIVRFEIESNFENRLNLRGLKMKTVSINVYSYDELSKLAQARAESDWLNSDPTYNLINTWENFVLELHGVGVELSSWKFDYSVYEVTLDRSCALLEYFFSGHVVIKKILNIYHTLAFHPKAYWLNSKKRISKIQKIKNEDHNWILNEFIYELEKTILRGDYRRSLWFCLNESIQQAAQAVQEKYDSILESFSKTARQDNFVFFEDGKRYYGKLRFENENEIQKDEK